MPIVVSAIICFLIACGFAIYMVSQNIESGQLSATELEPTPELLPPINYIEKSSYEEIYEEGYKKDYEPLNFDYLHAIIDELLAPFGNTVSVHFRNLDTGFTHTHNAYQVYFGASVTKLPFAFYIWQKAYDGYVDIEATMTFTQEDNWGGSGIIRHRYPFGTVFSHRYLLHLMIAPSDNIATRMLRRANGITGYYNFIYNLGGNPYFVQNITYSYIDAWNAGLFATEIFNFMENSSIYAEHFKNDLLANRYPFIVSDYTMASKSGWSPNAWHDIAIVYAPSPYTLVLLSSRDGNASDRIVYEQISIFFQELNTIFYR